MAWGCLSARQVWRWTRIHEKSPRLRGQLESFRERLWWRLHYFQKLEAEWQIEFEPINRALKILDRTTDQEKFAAWAEGRTGRPMVDACMRCLKATGWLNFRMRAMLVTVATFGLWLDWRLVAKHLGRLFLDYDPGIHYAQIQMQAGLTGYHMLRVYNDETQGIEKDPNGSFVHHWIPELQKLPAPLCHHPWKLTEMECKLYDFELGRDYPAPIIDFEQETADNRDRYWEHRKDPIVTALLPAIYEKHCLPEDAKKYHAQVEGH